MPDSKGDEAAPFMLNIARIYAQKEADGFKALGNEAMQRNEFAEAISLYRYAHAHAHAFDSAVEN